MESDFKYFVKDFQILYNLGQNAKNTFIITRLQSYLS